jgi:hypothetical protein
VREVQGFRVAGAAIDGDVSELRSHVVRVCLTEKVDIAVGDWGQPKRLGVEALNVRFRVQAEARSVARHRAPSVEHDETLERGAHPVVNRVRARVGHGSLVHVGTAGAAYSSIR